MYDDEFEKRRKKVLGITDSGTSSSGSSSVESDFERRRQAVLKNSVKPISEPTQTPSQVAGDEQKKPSLLSRIFDTAKKTFDTGKKIVQDLIPQAKQKTVEVGNSFVNEFKIQQENFSNLAQGKVSYNDLHRMSTTPAIQARIKDLEDQQIKKYSSARQKEIQDLQEVVNDNSGSLISILKRNTEAVKASRTRTIKSVVAGIAESQASTFLDTVSWVTRKNEKISSTFTKASDKVKDWAEELRPEDPNFVDQLAEGVGSALTFFVPSIGIAKLGGVFAKISPRVALFFGKSAATTLEAMSEAGSVYQDNVKQGKDKDEASKKATATFWSNVFMVGISNKLGILGEGKVGLKKIFYSAFFEGNQEAIQQAISNVNTGREATEGMLESGLIGSIIGGGLGSFDVGKDARESQAIQEKVINIIADREEMLQGGQAQQQEEPDKNVPDIIKQELDKNAEPNIIGEDGSINGVQKTDPAPLIEEAKKYKNVDEFIQAFTDKTNYAFGDNNIPKENVDLLNAFTYFAQNEKYQKLYQENKVSDIDVLKDFYNQYVVADKKVDTKKQLTKIVESEKINLQKIFKNLDKRDLSLYGKDIAKLNGSNMPITDRVAVLGQAHKNQAIRALSTWIVDAVNGRKSVLSPNQMIKVLDNPDLIPSGIGLDTAKQTIKNYPDEIKLLKQVVGDVSTPTGSKTKVISKKEVKKRGLPTKTIGGIPITYVKDLKPTGKTYKAGKVYASSGKYADLKNLTQVIDKQIKVVEFPELIRIVRNLTGAFPEVSKLRGRPKFGGLPPNGLFIPDGDGRIKLNRDIFNDEAQASKTLAHELGHLADYLPDKTMARGNLIGRIASLNTFLKETFSSVKTENEAKILQEKRKGLTKQRSQAEKEGNKELSKKLLAEIKELNKQSKNLRKNVTLRNSKINEELKEVTKLWKPFDEDINESYTEYRYSAPELYADSISMLFNDPALLKETAPTFWKGFFEHLDSKPSVKENFFKIWDLLNKGEDAVLSQREEDIRSMFSKGEDKFKVVLEEKKQKDRDIAFRLKYELIDKNQAIIDRVNKIKKEGGYVADELNPVYALEELNYVGGVVKNFVEENIQPIYEKVRNSGLTWEDIGEVLFLERVVKERGAVKNPILHIKGLDPDFYNSIIKDLPSNIDEMGVTEQLEEMKKKFGNLKDAEGNSLYNQILGFLPRGIANPLGFNVESANKQLEFLKNKLGDKFSVIEEVLPKYREAIKSVLDEAEKSGFYRKELIAEMKANPAYATFQVLDYMDVNIPASIKQQVGTLKEIANPATSTLVKTISMIRAIERNNVKLKIVDFLKNKYAGEIVDAKTIFNGKTQIPIEPKDNDLGLFTVMENGKFTGYYVDKYIAKSLEFGGTGEANAVLGILKFFNSKLYRPLFITFNLGFQSFNLFRDFLRFYKNVPNMTLWRALRRYKEAIPASKARAWGGFDKTISQMEKSKILGVTYNDIINGLSEDDKQIDFVLAKTGLSPLKEKNKPKVIKIATSILDAIEKTGNFIETLPKVAGYNELNGKIPKEQLGSFIRTSVGSPDFLRKGAGSAWYNEVFLFANAIKEGVRSDVAVATNPTTRGGYWWKTAKVTFLPKLVMFGVLAGLLGDELKKMMEDVSEYDKTNYLIIPLSRKNGKTSYLRIPQDETGRLLGGILWKILRMNNNEQSLAKDAQDLLSFTGGQVPSLSPTITTAFGIMQFLAGQNPYDFFRNRNVIPDLEFEAGGKYAFKPFATWVINQLGGGVFWKSYITEQVDKTWYQKTLDFPVVSNILGRWIKVSDQGQKDINKEILKGTGRASAVKSLEIRNKVDKAIQEYQKNPTMQNKYDIEKKLIMDVLGKESGLSEDEKRTKTNTVKKFRVGIVRGQGDINVNSLIDAQSNAEKVELLIEMKKRLSETEFNEIFKVTKDEKIISDDVVKEFNKTKDKTSQLPIKERLVADIFSKSKFKIVKEAIASTGENADMYNYGLPVYPVESPEWQKRAKELLRKAFTKLIGENVPEALKEKTIREKGFPYVIDAEDKQGYTKITLPNGVTFQVRGEEEKAKYLAGWQENYKEMTGLDWPSYAPDWKNATKKEEQIVPKVDIKTQTDLIGGEAKPTQKYKAKASGFLGKIKEVEVPEKIAGTIERYFGNETQDMIDILLHPEGDQVGGVGTGENGGFQTNIDVYNKDKQGNKKTVYNPFTDSQTASIDRGLFMVNNGTFFTYLNGKKERTIMYEAGIIETDNLAEIDWKKEWDKMNELEYNVKMAKIIKDKQGYRAWYGAPIKLLAEKR